MTDQTADYLTIEPGELSLGLVFDKIDAEPFGNPEGAFAIKLPDGAAEGMRLTGNIKDCVLWVETDLEHAAPACLIAHILKSLAKGDLKGHVINYRVKVTTQVPTAPSQELVTFLSQISLHMQREATHGGIVSLWYHHEGASYIVEVCTTDEGAWGFQLNAHRETAELPDPLSLMSLIEQAKTEMEVWVRGVIRPPQPEITE